MSEEKDQLSSVKLTRNAKGGTQIEVKVYDIDPEKARNMAVVVYDKIKVEYPE